MKLYEGAKQYSSKADQREAIKTTISEIELAEVKKLTKSMYSKLLTGSQYQNVKHSKIYHMCLLFVSFQVLINFWGIYYLFIEVKCDYLIFA